MNTKPSVICPNCHESKPLDEVLTAQSNQNVIYSCSNCNYHMRNIQTKKG
ncbi:MULTISPECIES: hypothetical protein [Bacillaceae]|nr:MULTISPECIES: hypothetical protein [Bacillaceae]QNG59032.1 hypothetical protein H4O14_14555 [Bacillus sp. PAMC26568]